MRPLEGSEALLAIEGRLARDAPAKVRDAIAEARASAKESEASLTFADGALALREGDLARAAETLSHAAEAFRARGEVEAAELAEIEASVASVRRGVRDLALVARGRMGELSSRGATERVCVAALVVRGTAERVLGDAAAALGAFLEAKSRATPFPDLKTQALNSLGTLYVVTGALGAARSVLEPAAELCHARGDVLGEAIAMGQLGAVALGLGDLALARQCLSKQEWLAGQLGDQLGRSRALVWLADVALEHGAPDDAITIAERARETARAAGLRTFEAYADRVIGRAKRHLGEDGRPETEAALATFREQRLPLGEALSTWDLALASSPVAIDRLEGAARSLASLALVDRVVEVLVDLHELGPAGVIDGRHEPDVALLLMTSALSGRRAEALESALVHEDPEGLAAAAEERTAARRNLASLAIASIARPGLVALVAVGERGPSSALMDRAFGGALAGAIGRAELYVWPLDVTSDALASDVAKVLGVGGRGALACVEGSRVLAPGFGGGTAARTEGLPIEDLLGAALASTALEVALLGGLDAGDARGVAIEAALTTAGLAPTRPIG